MAPKPVEDCTMSNIVVPQLGESVVEARVARWLKKEGDRVEVGEPVVELETEKIDLEVSAEHGGVIASIKRQEGEDVKIGELLAVDRRERGRRARRACRRQRRDSEAGPRAGQRLRRRPGAAAPQQRQAAPPRRRPPTRTAHARRQPRAHRQGSRRQPRRRPGLRHGRPRDEAGRAERARRCRRRLQPHRHAQPAAAPAAKPSARQPRASGRPHRGTRAHVEAPRRRSRAGSSRRSARPRC